MSELSSEVRSEAHAGSAGGGAGAPGGAPGPPGRDWKPVPPADRGRRVDAGLEAMGGLLAAVAAELVLLILRTTLQVRSVPERVLEWLLLFVPLDVFEAGIRRFGFDAKRYGLYAAILATLFVLAALGAVVLRRRWSGRALLGLALGLWLFVMLVVMPLTSAGPFAVDLITGTAAAVGGYLVAALTYAGVLALAREGLDRRDSASRPPQAPPAARPPAGRRAAWLLLGGAAAAAGATVLVLRTGLRQRLPEALVLDPQAPVPSGGLDGPLAHPTQPSSVLPPLPTPTPPPPGDRPAVGSDLEPPPPRRLTRDQDGAALPSGRTPGQLAEPLTSNADFYIVTKNAGGDPVLTAKEWRLRIDGEVGRPVEVDYANLRRLPAVEVTKTLECISNFTAKCELAPFGCDLIGTARWKGVRVRDVLALAGGPRPGAVTLATFGADEFTTALPIEVATASETLLAYEMNGEVLPREHGYPVRMLVPGRYGMKNAKWVVALRVTNREFVDWYGQRGWSRTGIVKTMTRIDVPAVGATLAPGEHRIAGIAYAGDRGVAYVEFSADGGATWEVAELLEPAPGRDAWVRWQGTFVVPPGQETLTLVGRATDGTGQVQPEPFSLPQPDGGAGWCAVDVRVGRS